MDAIKILYRQIKENSRVEVAFIRYANDPVYFEILRVTGTVEILDDKELENRLYKERAWLLNNIARAGVQSDVCIFRIVKGTHYIWNMFHTLKESEVTRVNF